MWTIFERKFAEQQRSHDEQIMSLKESYEKVLVVVLMFFTCDFQSFKEFQIGAKQTIEKALVEVEDSLMQIKMALKAIPKIDQTLSQAIAVNKKQEVLDFFVFFVIVQ